MNIDIARQRYKEVFLPDVIDNSQGDFLAKHVPMKHLLLLDHTEPTEQDKKNILTEEQVYDTVFSPQEDDQFVLVKGASGAGKSHLIRWFNSMLQLHKQENEIVLYIRRADNTLKGTIRQLVSLNEVKQLIDTNLYKRLVSASVTIPELELKNTIYYTFVNLIDSDDGRGGENGDRLISNVDRKHLIALFQNSLFKEHLMADDGPIERIYTKVAENKTNEINDQVAEFTLKDLTIDSSLRTGMINSGADDKARKIADKMMEDQQYVTKLTSYINKFRNRVVQRCTGLEPGDLREAVEEIRQALYRAGKTLTILIEDITAASGVDDSLLDALLTNRRGYTDKKLCRINSLVGVADGYYRDNFRTNTKGRIKKIIIVPDEMFNNDPAGLIEFFAKYLNTVSLSPAAITAWVKAKAAPEQYPVHEVTMGKDWESYQMGEESINLFPFTKHAILFLYQQQDITRRNPRALMRDLIEPYVKDAIESLTDFPVRRSLLQGMDPELQQQIYSRSDLDDHTKLRLTQFMYIWGNGKSEVYEDRGMRYYAGIPETIFKELKLPLIEGTQVTKPQPIKKVETLVQIQAAAQQVDQRVEEENEQVAITLKEVDQWINNKDYKLSIGATTKNVRALNDVRKDINDFLYEIIDWYAEGVSMDAVAKVKGTNGRFLVTFARQTMQSNAVLELQPTIESRGIIEAFVKWRIIGKEKWNFPHGADYLYRVLRWAEKVKSYIVQSIDHYVSTEQGGKQTIPTDYFSYAVAAEFYRLILNGYCKAYQKPSNLQVNLLLKENPNVAAAEGHTKTWHDLQKITNGSEGENARAVVLQYFNRPQGSVINSRNYEFDYAAFATAVRKVVNRDLHYEITDLQLNDPVRKRKRSSEYLKTLIERIPIVVENEKRELKECLDTIENLVDCDDIEDEEDIKGLIKDIRTFYRKAGDNRINASRHKNDKLLLQCTKEATAIYNAIQNSQQILSCKDPIEAMLHLSQNPLFGLKPFAELLVKVNNDLVETDSEIRCRMQKLNNQISGDMEMGYAQVNQWLKECQIILEEVKR